MPERPTGFDVARAAGSNVHADVLEHLTPQLLIIFLKRLQALGHDLVFPLAEIDGTGHDLLSFRVDPDTKAFHFTLSKKA